MKTLLLKLSVALVCVGILIVGGIGWAVHGWLHQNVPVPIEMEIVQIRSGETLGGLSQKLSVVDVIRWPKIWTLYARYIDKTSIKVGEYAVGKSISPYKLLMLFNSGDVIQHDLTFVEGSAFTDILSVIRSEPKIEQHLRLEYALVQLREYGFSEPHLEGWFFPDTYAYSSADTDISLLLRSYKKMRLVLDSEWQRRAEDLPYASPYEALIMASIVEKETGAPHERTEIAGVFVRRLQKGMRLQTDPTVIYGMGDHYKGNITRKDLKTATPYNTYVIKGLPPTPIAMPGQAAIHAALHPAAGSSLYFVAKGDGSHKFSSTLQQHVAAVKKYQKIRRENYRSSYQSSGDK